MEDRRMRGRDAGITRAQAKRHDLALAIILGTERSGLDDLPAVRLTATYGQSG
jgi:hypothetical protein